MGILVACLYIQKNIHIQCVLGFVFKSVYWWRKCPIFGAWKGWLLELHIIFCSSHNICCSLLYSHMQWLYICTFFYCGCGHIICFVQWDSRSDMYYFCSEHKKPVHNLPLFSPTASVVQKNSARWNLGQSGEVMNWHEQSCPLMCVEYTVWIKITPLSRFLELFVATA